MSRAVKYSWIVGIAVFLLSLTFTFFRLLEPVPVAAITFLSFSTVAAIAISWVGYTRGVSALRVASQKKHFLLAGIGRAATVTLAIQAVHFAQLAEAGLLLLSAPLWIVMFHLVSKEEAVSGRTIGSVILGLAGLALIIGPAVIAEMSKHTIGLLFGLGSGITYGATFIVTRRLRKEYEARIVMAWMYLIGAIVLAPFFIITPVVLDSAAFGYIVSIAVLLFSGIGLLTYALRHTPSQHASLINLLEPVFIAVWGYLFFQETLSFSTAVGGVILLITVGIANHDLQKETSAEQEKDTKK